MGDGRSELIGRLVEEGLIARRGSKDYELTARGRELLTEAGKQFPVLAALLAREVGRSK